MGRYPQPCPGPDDVLRRLEHGDARANAVVAGREHERLADSSQVENRREGIWPVLACDRNRERCPSEVACVLAKLAEELEGLWIPDDHETPGLSVSTGPTPPGGLQPTGYEVDGNWGIGVGPGGSQSPDGRRRCTHARTRVGRTV